MVDEPQVGQHHENVERKREYYHVIIFPEDLKFYTKKEGKVNTIVVQLFNSILFHKSGPGNKQYTYQ